VERHAAIRHRQPLGPATLPPPRLIPSLGECLAALVEARMPPLAAHRSEQLDLCQADYDAAVKRDLINPWLTPAAADPGAGLEMLATAGLTALRAALTVELLTALRIHSATAPAERLPLDQAPFWQFLRLDGHLRRLEATRVRSRRRR
jgi:hypothetical protein